MIVNEFNKSIENVVNINNGIVSFYDRNGIFQSIKVDCVKNPYKGLDAFQESDSDIFVGRKDLIEEAIEKLENLNSFYIEKKNKNRVLTITGYSGVGKSSFINAGLIPRLKKDKLFLVNELSVINIVDSNEIIKAFIQNMININPDLKITDFEYLDIVNSVKSGEIGLVLQLVENCLNKKSSLIIVMDQLETFYCKDYNEIIYNFLDVINKLTEQLKCNVILIKIIRSDFENVLFNLNKNLFKADTKFTIKIPNLSDDEVVQIIKEPAKKYGIKYTQEFIDLLIEEYKKSNQNSLPLLQLLLEKIWDNIKNDIDPMNTLKMYNGLTGVMSSIADEVYEEKINNVDKNFVLQVFLLLAEKKENNLFIKRSVEMDKLICDNYDVSTIKRIIYPYTIKGSRLLSIKKQNGVEILELIHDSIIVNWKTYKKWVEKYAERIAFWKYIEKSANEWEISNKKLSYLFWGEKLKKLTEYKNNEKLLKFNSNQMEFFKSAKKVNVYFNTAMVMSMIAVMVLLLSIFSVNKKNNEIKSTLTFLSSENRNYSDKLEYLFNLSLNLKNNTGTRIKDYSLFNIANEIKKINLINVEENTLKNVIVVNEKLKLIINVFKDTISIKDLDTFKEKLLPISEIKDISIDENKIIEHEIIKDNKFLIFFRNYNSDLLNVKVIDFDSKISDFKRISFEKYLVCLSGKMLYTINLINEEVKKIFQFKNDLIYKFEFIEGKVVLVGTFKEEFEVLDISGNEIIKNNIKPNSDYINDIYKSYENLIVETMNDLIVYDLKIMKKIWGFSEKNILKNYDHPNWSLSNNYGVVVDEDNDNNIHILDVKTGNEILKVVNKYRKPINWYIGEDNLYIINDRIEVYNLLTGKLKYTIPDKFEIMDVIERWDGHIIISSRNNIYAFEIESYGKSVSRKYEIESNNNRNVKLINNYLIANENGNILHIYNVENGVEEYLPLYHPSNIKDVSLINDSLLVVHLDNNNIYYWKLLSNKKLVSVEEIMKNDFSKATKKIIEKRNNFIEDIRGTEFQKYAFKEMGLLPITKIVEDSTALNNIMNELIKRPSFKWEYDDINDSIMCTGATDSTIRFWNKKTLHQVKSEIKMAGKVLQIIAHEDRIYVILENDQLICLNSKKGITTLLETFEKSVRMLKLIEKDKLLIIDSDNTVFRYDISNQVCKEIIKFSTPIRYWYVNNSIAIFQCMNNKTYCIDLRNNVLDCMIDFAEEIKSVYINNDKKMFIQDNSKKISIYDLELKAWMSINFYGNNYYTEMIFDENTQSLLCFTQSDDIFIWNLDSRNKCFNKISEELKVKTGVYMNELRELEYLSPSEWKERKWHLRSEYERF